MAAHDWRSAGAPEWGYDLSSEPGDDGLPSADCVLEEVACSRCGRRARARVSAFTDERGRREGLTEEPELGRWPNEGVPPECSPAEVPRAVPS